MKVLVTGGSGKAGRQVVHELLENGHEVVNADLRRPDPDGSHFVETDLMDVGRVYGAMEGCEAVVHLGAIPVPMHHSPEVVFRTNVLSTFTVFRAAEMLGVLKVVAASSLAALGLTFAPEPFAPLYAPVDEDHPLLVADAYALSKEVDERTCAAFHRRRGMTALAFRFHAIMTPEESRRAAEEVRRNPMSGANLFWGYVDVRDVALACRLGVESEGLGFEVFNVTAADTLCEEETEEMVRTHYPEMEIRERLEGHMTGFSIEKARRLLGYEPRHTWRREE